MAKREATLVADYKPKGEVLLLLAAIEKDPLREFNSIEAAQIMGCDRRAVGASVEYARRARMVFCRTHKKTLYVRGKPYPDQEAQDLQRDATDTAIRAVKAPRSWVTSTDDIRVPKVVEGWKPPVMVPPRGARA